jgi:hypothetical protein
MSTRAKGAPQPEVVIRLSVFEAYYVLGFLSSQYAAVSPLVEKIAAQVQPQAEVEMSLGELLFATIPVDTEVAN